MKVGEWNPEHWNHGNADEYTDLRTWMIRVLTAVLTRKVTLKVKCSKNVNLEPDVHGLVIFIDLCLAVVFSESVPTQSCLETLQSSSDQSFSKEGKLFYTK